MALVGMGKGGKCKCKYMEKISTAWLRLFAPPAGTVWFGGATTSLLESAP